MVKAREAHHEIPNAIIYPHRFYKVWLRKNGWKRLAKIIIMYSITEYHSDIDNKTA
jgi:hypothetical protein